MDVNDFYYLELFVMTTTFYELLMVSIIDLNNISVI